MNIRQRLIHLVTQYDIKQSTKRGYNRYALAQYIEAVNSIDTEAIDDIRSAISRVFDDRLRDYLLKNI